MNTIGVETVPSARLWALHAALVVLFCAGAVGASYAESAGNSLVHALGAHGGNMEGKEVRFGVGGAGLSIAVATDSTNGSANLAYDSLLPLGGLIAMAICERAR